MAQVDRATATAPASDVLAVVVSAGATAYLARTLRAVAGQTHAPDVVLVVDTASRDNGLGDGTPIEEIVEDSGIDDVAPVRIVRAPTATTFLAAVRQGLASYAELVTTGNRRRGRGPGGEATTGRDTGSFVSGGPRPRTMAERLAGGGSGPGSLAGPAGARSPITRTEADVVGATEGTGQSLATGEAWLWLLHDDSAPAADCLAELLRVVVNARSVAMAGPKQVGWDRPDQLLEVGLRTTASARRANDIVPGEIDQGQYDGRSDVLAVGTAGALIDRSAWNNLDAVPSDITCFGDGLAVSRALRLAGHRVVVVPEAEIRHRRAAYLGLRGPGAPGRHAAVAAQPKASGRKKGKGQAAQEQTGGAAAAAVGYRDLEPDPDRSFRARRVAQLRSWLTFSSKPLPLLLAWIVVLGLGRSLWRLLSKSPGLAGDEIAAALALASQGARLRRDRQALDAPGDTPRSVLAELYLPAKEIRAVRRDRARQDREKAARAAAPSELELRELAALTFARRRGLAVAVAVALVVGLAGTSGILLARSVTGGALAGLDGTWHEMWSTAWGTWSPSGDGYATTVTPFLALLAPLMALGSLLGLGGDAVIHLLLVLTVPLAALGAWFAAGTLTRRTSARAWAAITWSCAPALLLALGQGRLGPVLAHLTLPWALTALARAVGLDRRDVVLSGLVGAHKVSDAERAELERFASERMESLAHLDEEAAAEEAAGAGRAEAAEGAEGAETAEAAEAAEATETDSRAASGTEVATPAGVMMTAPLKDGGHGGAQEAAGGDEPGDAVGPARRRRGRHVRGPVDDDPATPVLDDGAAVVDAQTRRGAAARAAATEQYGPGSPTAAAVAGLLLSGVVAAAPSAALVIVPALLLLLVVAHGSRLRLLLTVVPTVATIAPACLRAWHLAGADGSPSWHDLLRYLLTDTGVPVAAPAPNGVEMLLGLAVSRQALGGGVLSLVLMALLGVIPLMAVAGLATSGRRGHIARGGFLVALGGLALSVLAVRHVTALGTSLDGTGAQLVTGWAGTGLSLALAGLLASALCAVDAVRADLVRHERGWRHVTAGVVGVVALVAPLAVGGAWAVAAARSTGTGTGAATMALRPGGSKVPVIASRIQASASHGRVLVLSSTDDGMVVSLWRGDGTQLTDVTADVLSTQLRTRVPDAAEADMPALSASSVPDPAVTMDLSDPADVSLADAVTRAVSGQDQGAAAALASHGVAVVLLTDRAGDETTAAARAGLSATPGLEALAQTSIGTSWRVSSGTGDVSAVSLVSPDGSVSALAGQRPTVEAAQQERTLVLAQRSDDGWSAALGGHELQVAPAAGGQTTADGSASEGWAQAFVVPAGVSGELVVTRASTPPVAYVIWVAWAVAALAALPLRRQRNAA